MWNDNDILLAIRGLRSAMCSLPLYHRTQLKRAARAQVRRLILNKRVEAANVLRVMTGIVEPEGLSGRG